MLLQYRFKPHAGKVTAIGIVRKNNPCGKFTKIEYSYNHFGNSSNDNKDH